VIFVASDVDLKKFARGYLQPALDLSRQVIVYMSRTDRALGFSTLVVGASSTFRLALASGRSPTTTCSVCRIGC
jgi:esterase/lipase superfamily enzyme